MLLRAWQLSNKTSVVMQWEIILTHNCADCYLAL